jgi:YHS domain-containing protein
MPGDLRVIKGAAAPGRKLGFRSPRRETLMDTAKAYPIHAARDPVCGMSLDPRKAAFSAELDGTSYYFCSEGCRASFVAGSRDPAGISRWTKRGPPAAA